MIFFSFALMVDRLKDKIKNREMFFPIMDTTP